MFSLKGKTAIVTGSTSGIGFKIAEILAINGANILINGFGEPEKIQEILNNLKKFNTQISYSNADISNYNEVENMVQKALIDFGNIDILVNNAGIQNVELIEKFPLEKWHAVINTNLNSVFYTIRNCLPIMKDHGWGRIINIASTHGLVASLGKSAYVAAKHGVIGLTKTVALECATMKITCNSIAPGWVLTPLVEAQIKALQDKFNITYEEAEIKLLAEKHPSLRFTTPEQIGEMVLFLCSESASNMTGGTITMDGGWTAI